MTASNPDSSTTPDTSTTTTTATITPTLFYHGDALAAAQFYTSILPNSRINDTQHYPYDASTPMTINLTLLSTSPSPLNLLFINVHASSASHFPWTFNESFSLSVVCDTQSEIDGYWDALVADGGEGKSCCWCKDKFGVSWQIVPRLLVKTAEEGGERAKRAHECMLTWVKADIEGLRRAIDGVGEV